MYNNECKREFLKDENYMADYMEVVIGYFNLIEKHEVTHNKDLSNFSLSEIEAFYKSLFSKSLERLIIINNCYERYTKYMLRKNLVSDRQNHYSEIDKKLLNSFLATTDQDIIGKKELYDLIKPLDNPCDQFLILGLFEGIYGKNYSDFYELTMDSFEGNILHLPMRDLKVSKKLLSYAESAADEYFYYKFDHGGLSNVNATKRYFKPDDQRIMKERVGMVGEERRGRRIQIELDRCRRYLNHNALTAKGLRESGRIDMIKELMERNSGKDIKELIIENREKIVKVYGKFTNNSIDTFLLKYGNYLK